MDLSYANDRVRTAGQVNSGKVAVVGAVTVTMVWSVEGTEMVWTVVVTVDVGAVLVKVVVVVDVSVGDEIADEHAEERTSAGYLASASGFEEAARFSTEMRLVGSKRSG